VEKKKELKKMAAEVTTRELKPESIHNFVQYDSTAKIILSLKIEIKDLKERVLHLEENLSVNTKIYDLASDEYELNFPVDVILKNISEDEVLALMPELELYGEGSIESKAIDDLKIELIEMHDDLNSIPDANLSRKLKSSKRIINKLIKKINESKRKHNK
jgi:hypothetical protein